MESPLAADEVHDHDAVVIDSPRAGAKAQAEAQAPSTVRLMIGVSCNRATFGRDAAIVTATGFQLETVTPVDQCVYSAHVELVGVFRG